MRYQLKMTVRQGKAEDAKELKALVLNTIKNSCNLDYNPNQIEAWISAVDNAERWQKILTKQFVLVSLDEQKITGLCTLSESNYVDLFYIHQDYQRKGIATKLYTELEKEARHQKQKQITVDASKTAKAFFDKMGFQLIKKQTLMINDVFLDNCKMVKTI
ncbi:MAG TPA: GNAT family N-acetyltransferase [Pelobium sp.]